ncbi:hypothetical protein HOJ36_03705 [Candidatus Woesearchaeota archaeon]|jgi:hypothetical protein|nr:hypothetical protein [Candidatus Woesearchaeota archaeon]
MDVDTVGETLELTITQIDIVVQDNAARKMGTREEQYHSCISFTVGEGDGVNPVYDHIDNEFFSPFYRSARLVLQEITGLTAENLEEDSVGLFLKEYKARFVQELRVGDSVMIYSKFIEDKSSPFYALKAKHVMVREGVFVHEKIDTLVFTDLENGGFLSNLDNYDRIRGIVDSLK